MIAALAVAYGVTDLTLQGTMRSKAVNAVSAALPMSTGEVPESVQNSVISRLQNIPGLDELSFFPLAGDRTGIYATVNLGYDNTQMTSTERLAMESDIDHWFEDVYSGATNVADAEIYFLLDGRTVGGAGLGEAAYRHLGTRASTGEANNLVQALRQATQVTGEGLGESWYETQP
jgi:hypothetical protein